MVPGAGLEPARPQRSGDFKCLPPYSRYIPVHLIATQTSGMTPLLLYWAALGVTECVTYLSLEHPRPPGRPNCRCNGASCHSKVLKSTFAFTPRFESCQQTLSSREKLVIAMPIPSQKRIYLWKKHFVSQKKFAKEVAFSEVQSPYRTNAKSVGVWARKKSGFANLNSMTPVRFRIPLQKKALERWWRLWTEKRFAKFWTQ